MEEYLGVLPGNASVMSLINDKDNRVQLVIDDEVAKMTGLDVIQELILAT